MKKSSPPNLKNPRSKRLTRSVSIVGTGSYTPARVMANSEFEKLVDTSDEWIRTRTGIRERRIAAPGEFTSDMAAEAARRAMADANIKPEEIDLIMVATITPDMPFPSTACFVQQKIGATKAACFDVEAACAGFLYVLEIAQQFITAHTYNTILIIGAEKLSSIIDWQDRNTCVLFGDAAGAAILRNRSESEHGVITTCLGTDGSKAELLYMPGGGSRCPATHQSVDGRLHHLHMEGKEVFKSAVGAMQTAAEEVLRRCGLTIEDIDCIIPHQANVRIIEAIAERINAPKEKLFINLDRYGNTSAASVILALDEAVRSGRVKRGDLLLLVVFGAGFTWAASVIQW
ncbi:MAG: ketoacyl-ACP synthase III [Verrucomicrobiae bacterium]|nr:ketoacyl-ACP synthase III [Verrucomicrobiae bacterium]